MISRAEILVATEVATQPSRVYRDSVLGSDLESCPNKPSLQGSILSILNLFAHWNMSVLVLQLLPNTPVHGSMPPKSSIYAAGAIFP